MVEGAEPTARGTESMRADALAGGKWTALESLFLQLSQVAVTAVLARLLVPEQYGEVAAATIVIGLFALITDVGLAASLIRSERINRLIVSSYFWIAVGLGTAVSVAVIVLAKPLAASFGNPAAAPLMAGLSALLFFGATTAVADAQLRRALRFRARALIQILEYSVYGVVAVFLAATTDAGAWSIVLGRIFARGVAILVLWMTVPIRPRFEFDFATVRDDLSFNAGVLGTRVSSYLSKNVDYWYVGAVLGPITLGIYYIAYTVPALARQRMTLAAQRVLFPVLSRMEQDSERVRRAIFASIRFVSLLALPVLLGMASVSGSLVPFLFGNRWDEAITPLAILAVTAAVESILPVPMSAFFASGRSFVPATVQLIRGIGILALALTLPGDGLTRVAYAVLGGSILAFMAALEFSRRLIGLSPVEIFRAMSPALVPAGLMIPSVIAVSNLTESTSDGVSLGLQVAAGVIVYLSIGWLLHRGAFRSWLGNLKDVILPRKSAPERA